MIISSEDRSGTRLRVTQSQANWLITQLSESGSAVRIDLQPENENELAGETARGEESGGYEVRR